MAGSLTLHWKERLTDDDVCHINELLELFEVFAIDEDELRDELMDTEMMPDEVEQLIEDHGDE